MKKHWQNDAKIRNYNMDTIKNFVQLTENFGTAGQPTADQFPIVAANGYKHVINIGLSDNEDALPNEGAIVTALGMNYIHIPVPIDNPTPEQLRVFCKLLYPLRHEKVFLHCIMNYRISAFMYHYLSKVEHRSEQESSSIMLERWNIYPIWKEVLTWTADDIGL